MKKLINVRAPLFLAVALILGIYSCYEWFFGDVYFGLAVALLLIALIIFSAIKGYAVRKIAIVMLMVAILGFGIARLSLYRVEKREMYGENVTICGRVCDLNRNRSENSTYYLEKCTLSDGETLQGRIQLRVYNKQLHTGDVVTVSGNISSTSPIKSTVESYMIRNQINYELTDVEVISIKSGTLKPDEKVRKYIYDVTCDYMLQNGDVMYALLTGDRGAISSEINYVFTRAGILHLLAVSGLHVGFIVTLICFALKRLRLHPLIECAIVLVPLLFYAYVCAFTPSVMRAIIMVVCSYITRAGRGRYDMLSAISIAMLLILLAQPFYLFDVGFQLSFLSVYGITTLYASLDRWLNRRKINKFIRYIIKSLFISLSCIIATVFTVAINFGEVPVLSVLLNVIVIPLISVVFMFGIFGLIPSVFHYLLVAAEYVLRLVITLAQAVSEISFATVAIPAVAISTVIIVVALFVSGGYVNINKVGKRIFYPICAVLLVCSTVLSVVPKTARNQAYVAVTDNSAVVATVSRGGEAALILDFDEYSNIYNATRYLRQFNLSNCTLYIADCSGVTLLEIDLLMRLPIDTVYLLGTESSALLETECVKRSVKVIHQYPNSTTGEALKVQSHFDSGLLGVNVALDNIAIFVAYGSNSSVEELIDSGIKADLLVLSQANAKWSDKGVLTITPYQSKLRYNYGANKYGNFTIKQKGVKMFLSFR